MSWSPALCPVVDIDDLDAAATLAGAQDAVRRRREAEVDDLTFVLRWADLHSNDPRRAPGGTRAWGGQDRLVDLGGDGTPQVQELCLPELAIARGVHALALRAAMADALDLRHRLPAVMAALGAGHGEVWVARKVAALSRRLDRFQVRIVDAAVAAATAGESPSRVLAIAEAKVIEADRDGHRARLERERRTRKVTLGRIDEHGLQHVIARIEAGDAAFIDALVDQVADVLATRPELTPDLPEAITKGELRAVAFGWLAHPADLLELLAGPAPTARRRPEVVLYVHLHQAALDGTAAGVARVEGLGPLLLEQIRALVSHARITVKPVIDLADQVSVNAYEFPEAVRERTHLRHLGEVFPHASRLSRRVDLDHPDPFDRHGPPGQTGDHNVAPLGRTHHRAKTHLGYRVIQTGVVEHLWTTPHGLHRRVDTTGTHEIDDTAFFEATHPGSLRAALDRIVTSRRVSSG